MPIHSPEFRKKKQKKRRLFLIAVLSVFLILFGFVVYASYRPEVTIREIQVNNNSVVKDSDIEIFAREAISGKYFWIFPKQNSFIYPRGDVRESLLSNLPRLSSVKLDVIDFKTLSITVSEREPDYLYCKKAGDEDAEDCYFIDDTGYIFSLAPSFSGSVYFVFTLKEPIENPIGQRFLPEEEFIKLVNFVSGVEDVGVYPQVLQYSNEESIAYLSNSSEILWKTRDGADIAERNLKAFLSDATIAKDVNFLDKILYIDLRFDNKVFYKFRE